MTNKLTAIARYSAVALVLGMPLAAHAASAKDSDKDGIPNNAEVLLGTDPLNPDTDGDGINDLKDKQPTFLADPISQSGKPAPFTIKEALVENNYDYQSNKAAPDHLELAVANQTGQPLTGFSLYYTIRDQGDQSTQAFFMPLKGFTVPANAVARINVDENGLPGHFRADPNSSYYKSANAKDVTFELKLDGYKPVTAKVHKDKGGAETAD